MCKVLYTLFQCGHQRSITYPHTPCAHYLANVALSGLDASYKSNLRQCRAARVRKVKTLRDDFCAGCEAHMLSMSPRGGARLAREMQGLGLVREADLRVWLVENVFLAQWQEDRMIDESVVDSEFSEMTESMESLAEG